MKITVIGTGYVGLVSGTCFAEYGHDVVCLDIDTERVNLLCQGVIPIHEPGLADLVKTNIAKKTLRFTNNIDEAVKHGHLQFIAVGTPADEDGTADLRYVINAAKNIGSRMEEYKVIINKSTVPVGTGDKISAVISEILKERDLDVQFSVASNPEFLKEGSAVEDFMRPDRVVIGSEDERALSTLKALYAPFTRNHQRTIVMGLKSAELTKYAANAMLATRISFMNEIGNYATEIGADIEQIRLGIGSDPRIGFDFLYSGCGYGGSCFPKDVKALINSAKNDAGITLNVLSAVETVNHAQKQMLLQKLKTRFKILKNRHFAIWGLAFKPNTDDMREAPSLDLINGIVQEGGTVSAYDPVAIPEARRIFEDNSNVKFADNSIDTLINADALIVITEWKEFRTPNFAVIKTKLRNPIIFDGRNIYEPKELRANGIEHFNFGRR
jgi:UDPglucose 6-dehydrogenase